MYDCSSIDPNIQLEAQSIIDIEAAQCDYDERPPDPHDDEEENEDDMFGHCDSDGNELCNIDKTSNSATTFPSCSASTISSNFPPADDKDIVIHTYLENSNSDALVKVF